MKKNLHLHTGLLLALLSFLSWGCGAESGAEKSHQEVLDVSYTSTEPQSITLDFSLENEPRGGLIAIDLNNDGQKDFLITKPGHIAAYEASGKKLWAKQVNIQVTEKTEDQGLPGLHAPGIQAGDVDGDREIEVLFLTPDNTLQIVRGADGENLQSVQLEPPQGTDRWEHLVIANFRGLGDRDLLLQATSTEEYRWGRSLAAYSLDDVRQGGNIEPEPLWTRDDFLGAAHSGARVADLDGDGKDEVVGGTIVSSDGEVLFQVPVQRDADVTQPHIDAVAIADVRSDIPGLEVVALEEGGSNRRHEGGRGLKLRWARVHNVLFGNGNRVFLYNSEGLIWENHLKHQEPQNTAVGDFDPDRPGLEVWCRSRYNENQKPFVFDAKGELIANYELEDVAPPDWTNSGVEVIFPINWTGKQKQLAAAKERHKSGDVAIFDPLTGEFLYRFPEKADRLYVADIVGDWREEVAVIKGDRLHIYRNDQLNPNPDLPELWTQEHYSRSKMTWNYYNP